MEMEEATNIQDLNLEEQVKIIQSWFEKYEIKKIIFKRPDLVFYLEE